VRSGDNESCHVYLCGDESLLRCGDDESYQVKVRRWCIISCVRYGGNETCHARCDGDESCLHQVQYRDESCHV
jgi:hypothetical protein